ncbi:TPA: hypothetical protein ACF1IQ_001395 [Yersinia enterocolitica]
MDRVKCMMFRVNGSPPKWVTTSRRAHSPSLFNNKSRALLINVSSDGLLVLYL